MRKKLYFILIGTLILLVFSFNLVKAQNNSLESILNLLKNLLSQQISQNQLKIESPENIFQKVPEYKPVAEYEKLITDIVEKASPAVVSIIISKNVPVFEKYYINPFEEFDLPPEFKEFFEFQIPQYRQKGTKKKEIGAGTGFVISPDGLIATNKHVVIEKDAEYTVYFNDGRKYKAKVVAIHPVDDLAIIKINAKNLPYLTLGDSDKLKLGQTVIAIGNALGEFQNTVSVGVVSGLRRNIVATDEKGRIERLEGLIQTDAAINPGNSGGPLINLRGEVIGINTAIARGAENIGFAIPVNRLKNMIYEISVKGKIEVPFLGIRYLLITEEIQKQFNLPFDYGVYVYSDDPNKPAVIPNSPAEKYGIKEKDIILEVDGQKITLQNTLAGIIRSKKVGDEVSLKIYRDGKFIYLKVKLGSLPKELSE